MGMGRPNGCRYVGRNSCRRNTNEIQWQVKKSEWKNSKIWKPKGKAMDTNTGSSPGYQSQPNSLEQGFPTCGPRAKSGLPILKKWPSTSQKIKIKIYTKTCKN